ncbi:hypothetical protein HPT25_00560 [Bacillus sp. BRMEA1]|uniref:PilN domain-containing protein n=1 Tax=Neobacillus endophyticus TaxID=2738405 RepID=UPI001563A147|nr:hypothetical protein [Neobacillus endophyticus]NRD75998.1 hypothetical protein [Neobacillus endophyticus]
MLVEINLLPEKEPKKYRFWIFASGLGALFLIFGCYFYFQIQSVKSSIESVDQQISQTQKIEEQISSKPSNSANNTSVSQLKAAVDWAKNYPIQTIPVMQHLVALLPERGFIQNFTYADSGDIKLSVQFDLPSDAAYFLDNLNAAKWISGASLTLLTAGSNANSADSSTAANSSTASAASTNNQTDHTTTASSQTNSSTAGNTSAPVSSAVNTGVQTTSSGSSADSISNDYMPRYTGQFTITLNKDAAKKLMEQGQNDGTAEQGVNGS